jgi:BCCT family betaine/carnitine transporter
LAASATKSLAPEDHPDRGHRVFWAFLLGLLPITLVYMGGLKPLQSAVTLASVPLYAVTVILTISLWRSIHAAEQVSSGAVEVSEAS